MLHRISPCPLPRPTCRVSRSPLRERKHYLRLYHYGTETQCARFLMYISTYGGNRPVRTPPVCQKPPSKPITNTPSIGTPLRQPPQTVINLLSLPRLRGQRALRPRRSPHIRERTRLVNEIWIENTLGNGDMEHQHGAVTKDHQEEQSTGHVEPAGHQQRHEHGIHED